jgi:putative ubiquitin-RnfH superfamily antitoxin RatB of RatAB toxin-antitoxin module
MSELASIHVSVMYSPAAREWVEHVLTLPANSTVAQALQACALLTQHPEINFDTDDYTLGVWGRTATMTQALRDKDRVEIYRALKVDPKVARRERFQKQGTRGAGLFSKRRPGAKPGY